MHYQELLAQLHARLQPANYVEIGIKHGESLVLARAPAIGIDPRYEVRVELSPAVSLFRETSDRYFERSDPLQPFGGRPIAFAFIDGMHRVEYALRDFINLERHSHWAGVAAFHDVLPRSRWQTRRYTWSERNWSGDVYRIADVLARRRPDLIRLLVADSYAGILLVLGLDPANAVLADEYRRIVRSEVRPWPRRLPLRVLEREGALDPQDVLSASFWSILREAQSGEVRREEGLPRLRAAVERDFS